MSDAIILTQEQLNERLTYWQGVLRLQDWDITVEIARETKMAVKESRSCISMVQNHRRADMQLVSPDDYDPGDAIAQDMESGIVHELLHIYFNAIGADDSNDRVSTAIEQVINVIAKALVGLSRSNRPHAAQVFADGSSNKHAAEFPISFDGRSDVHWKPDL